MVCFVNRDGFILPSAPNFRDLGGHRTESGRTVRPGLLFRSDALHSVSTEDLSTFNGLGIRQLLDLRTSHERENLPDMVPEGAEYAVVGVQDPEKGGANFSRTLLDPEAARAMFGNGGATRFMNEVYRDLVSDTEDLAGYRDLVERAAKGPTSLVFHCSAGKDRTGWGAALLLTLLGVGRETVVGDYMESNTRQANTEKWMRLLSEHSGLDWEDVVPMTRVRAEYLHIAFEQVDDAYGSFDTYVSEGLRVDGATLEALRERMLV